MPYYRGNVVSDAYLQSLLLAYRQAYVNAGGPDYEDSDQPLLDKFAASGIVDTSGAAGLGRIDAAADIAAGQDAHPQSLSYGGSIPITAPTGTPTAVPPIVTASTSGGDAIGFLTLDGLPTGGGSAAPNPTAAALVATGALSPIAPASTLGGLSSSSIGGFSLSTLLLVGALGFGAWYLLKGK